MLGGTFLISNLILYSCNKYGVVTVCGNWTLSLILSLLFQNSETISQVAHEQIIVLLAPLLENNHPTQEICDFFSKVC